MSVSRRPKSGTAAAHTRLLGLAILALATLALALLEARVPREARLPPDRLLIRVFETVVFYLGTAPPTPREAATKWDISRPIAVALTGDVRPAYRAAMAEHAAALAALTGLTFIVSDAPPRDPGAPRMRIHFGPWRELAATFRDYRRERMMPDRSPQMSAFCFGSFVGHPVIGLDFMYISTDEGLDFLRHCLLEELTQGLGLPNDTDLILPSVFSTKSAPTRLTLNDMVLVRALYDERIPPGLPKAETMARIRTIIPELTAAVRRHGPEALVHPRHRTEGAGTASGR